jgi:hypothetical protein
LKLYDFFESFVIVVCSKWGYLVSLWKTAPEGKKVASMSVGEEQEEKKSCPYPGSCERQPIAKKAPRKCFVVKRKAIIIAVRVAKAIARVIIVERSKEVERKVEEKGGERLKRVRRWLSCDARSHCA